ncbi:2-(1,2-epoxy-1,2-dihydrophenyl)acetyl-CoA isomerase PaaG [Sphingomonas sp. PP-CC-3G-468]|uniref:2-(1,2-epoxy-1,2-dihydrophenyl)acetyl-CoA isomerase PaaG n=1 Tax=Sphingomonas sp. PP-CC-3G-468 TaxID=2135656 RepID=UPI0010530EAF|nr:2-(1,2-epoxy-1,2-dihydrophenyl)acetyl-CoA isomerase PaaG [Sphingomonas sp. PP-CC-3G-468]TCM02917.1 enoyl-CoA hydratase [Sphingomonas sp. PP-CC-3G-468]
MTYETIILAIADGIARLKLNRPDRLNSFTVAMHVEVAAALDTVEGDSSIRTLLVTGAGRAFCAGQDLADRAVSTDAEPVDLGKSVERYYNPLIRRLVALPMPVVCAVNGVAAGAGANIALACDIVIAARSAKFIQSFAKIGLIPDSGGSWILPRLVGQARALGMALTGDPVSAQQAAEWGLIWKVVNDADLEATVNAVLTGFASAPTAGLAATKRLIRQSWQNDLNTELDIQRDTMRALGRADDYREGVAAFLEKRTPRFTGR